MVQSAVLKEDREVIVLQRYFSYLWKPSDKENKMNWYLGLACFAIFQDSARATEVAIAKLVIVVAFLCTFAYSRLMNTIYKIYLSARRWIHDDFLWPKSFLATTYYSLALGHQVV